MVLISCTISGGRKIMVKTVGKLGADNRGVFFVKISTIHGLCGGLNKGVLSRSNLCPISEGVTLQVSVEIE